MKKYDLIVFTGGGYAYAPRRVVEEARNSGLETLLAYYRDFSARISDGGFEVLFANEELPLAKGVFLRALGEDAVYNALKVYILDYYRKNGVKVLNSRSFEKWPSLDKTMQYLGLKNAGIPIVDSFFFGSKVKMLEWAKNEQKPIIVKESVGSLGTGVYKINTDEELAGLLEEYSIKTVKTLLVQRFLEGGQDLRVIVLGGKVLGAMKRIARPGTHLTNYSQGGSVEGYDISKDQMARNIAVNVANTFELDYCGVDLMRAADGSWKVLEVNRACQFQGFEKSTGINVAREVVDYLIK